YPIFIKIKHDNIYCNYFARTEYYNESLVPLDWSSFVLSYDDIKNNLGDVINKWFEINQSEFEQPINLLIEYLNEKKRFHVNQFLMLVKAIEVFDRNNRDKDHFIIP